MGARLLAAALSMLAVVPAARAQGGCSAQTLAPLEARLAKHPFTGGRTDTSLAEASDCTPWPGDDGVTIVAAIYRGASDDQENFALALVDSDTDEGRSAFKGHFDTSPFLRIGPASLGIDTAPYRLAAGVRAFGIDLPTARPKPPCAGGIGARRTLFVAQRGTLRPVLDSLALSAGSSPRCDSSEPNATTSRTIAIGRHASHGCADLVVAETTEAEGAPTRRKRHTMRYDGSAYRTDDPLWPCCMVENGIEAEPAGAR